MMTGAGGLLLLSMVFVVEPAGSTGLASKVQHEIGQLLGTLEKSDCKFYRNGTWYDGQHAAAHLQNKYTYLLNRGLVPTTESFIERAASRSSMSGQAYLVRCGSGEPGESKKWFDGELQKLRKDQP